MINFFVDDTFDWFVSLSLQSFIILFQPASARCMRVLHIHCFSWLFNCRSLVTILLFVDEATLKLVKVLRHL